MKPVLKGIFAFGMLGLIVSCASAPTTETNKSPGLITKIYVLVDVGDWKYEGGDFGTYLATNLEKKLQQDGVDTKAGSVTGLELDKDKYKKEMSDFGATKIMLVRLSGITTNDSFEVIHGVFDISILDAPNMDAPNIPTVWRAKITANGPTAPGTTSWVDHSVDADNLIDNIISALRKHGLMK